MMYIHGVMDAKSRLWLALEVYTNNTAACGLRAFYTALDRCGNNCGPARVRVDQGVENGAMTALVEHFGGVVHVGTYANRFTPNHLAAPDRVTLISPPAFPAPAPP